MSFLNPEFLYYMLPPLLILFALLLTQKEAQLTFFSDDVLDRLKVSSNILTLKARTALFMLIGILILIALANPVIKDGVVEVKAKSSDIMLAIDISDSMLATDVYPNRLKLAKQKALEILRVADGDRIGVIAFAKNSYLVSPLSFDHEAVAFLLNKLNTNSITEKGTNFLSMLEVVANSLNKDARKYLLVLSDGGDSKDFSKEIEFAKDNDIAVFVLGLGTKQGSPIKKENGEYIKQNGKIIVTKLNENISLLATQTGGVYIENVNSNKDVKVMLKEIAKHSEKKELKSEKIEKYIPLFYYPVGLALMMLLFATTSMSKREKVEVPSVFLIFLILFSSHDSYAFGLFDFKDLDEAKKAYLMKDYKKAQDLYLKYAQSSSKDETYYNVGNSLYMQGKYKEAIGYYEKARFDNKEQRAENFANMGNAFAKLGDIKNLEEAIKSYENSLKIKDDKEVKENLDAVKEALKNMKQKDKNKQNQQKNHENKNKQNNKNQKKDDKKEDSKKNQQNKGDKKENQQNNEKNKEQKEKNKPADKKNKEQKNGNDADSKKNNQKKDDLEKKNEDKNQSQKFTKSKMKMSDAEEKKWLKRLGSNQTTFLYMLNKNSSKDGDKNEKPW